MAKVLDGSVDAAALQLSQQFGQPPPAPQPTTEQYLHMTPNAQTGSQQGNSSHRYGHFVSLSSFQLPRFNQIQCVTSQLLSAINKSIHEDVL
jgi:hypothetical protein